MNPYCRLENERGQVGIIEWTGVHDARPTLDVQYEYFAEACFEKYVLRHFE